MRKQVSSPSYFRVNPISENTFTVTLKQAITTTEEVFVDEETGAVVAFDSDHEQQKLVSHAATNSSYKMPKLKYVPRVNPTVTRTCDDGVWGY
jgi:hypothetical protein